MQFNQRWAGGRSKQWDSIDSRTPSAEQQQLVGQVDQEIVAAAALDSGMNYLTKTVNQPITLGAPAQAYVSIGRPQTAANPSAASRSKRKRRADTPEAVDEQEDNGPENDMNMPIAKEDEDADANTSTAPAPRPEDQEPEVPAIAVQAPPAPAAAARPAPTPIAAPLEMIHGKLIEERSGGTYNVQRSPRAFVDQTSPLYKYGGIVRRVRNGTASMNTMDVMVCDADECDFCGTYDPNAGKDRHTLDKEAQAAEHNDEIPGPDESPWLGLPWVHAVRDLRNSSPGGPGVKGRIFTPTVAPTGLCGGHRLEAVVVFDDRFNLVRDGGGCIGRRRALTCGNDCQLCIPKEYRLRDAARESDRQAGGPVRRLVKEDE